MPINIEMPKLSDTMTEGTLIKWNKQVGDTIEIGDVIAEVETDKATMEMEAFDEGVLHEIIVEAGGKVDVGATLGVMLEEGEEPGDAAGAAPITTPTEAKAESAPAASSSAPAAQGSSSQATSYANGDRIKASPLARKVAGANGVDIATVTGSGPGGRIVKADVEAAAGAGSNNAGQVGLAAAATALAASVKQKATGDSSAPAASAPAASAPVAIVPAKSEEDQIIPLSSMRKVIAERLLTSKTTIPHFYLHVEADVAPLMTLRKQINSQAEQTHGNKYSVNDFILKAVINAAQAVPEVNASFNGDSIVQFAKVGVSVAIAVEDGLVTPVIKDAASKSMLAISQEVKGMAGRAREKKLHPSEFDNGTITVSNLGAWGIESFDAIVNPPQAVILSVGAMVEKAVVKDGAIVPGLRMNIGVSCDHRVVDGAVAARFLNEVKKLIEKPALMLV